MSQQGVHKKSIDNKSKDIKSDVQKKQSISNKPSTESGLRKASQEFLEDPKDGKKSQQKLIERDLVKYNSPYPVIKYDYQDYSESKHHLNLIIVGHVDSGKSTLTGHLLYLLKQLDEKTMHRNEKDSSQSGKASFKFAWAIDETKEERDRGITMDVAYKTIRTRSKLVTILDAPGHRDFIPNMINGASQADAAILVIDTVINAFEAGFEKGGQTREHAYLIKALGVNQVIIAMNKLDTVQWSFERYSNVKEVMKDYLMGLGFEEQNLFFVPISAFLGVNITDPKHDVKQLQWYKGPCLVDIVDKLAIPQRDINKPLRVGVSNCYQSNAGKLKGLCVSGKVEGGVIMLKQKCLILPKGIACVVKGDYIYSLIMGYIEEGF